MSFAAGSAIVLAAALDRTLAEPPNRFHPVALFGSVVAALVDHLPDTRTIGVIVALGVPIVAAVCAVGIVVTGARIQPILAPVLAGLILFSCTSRQMLVNCAHEVVHLTTTDSDRAREALRAVAGRDAAQLSAEQLRSAAVESAAENLSDGLIAPLLGFAVGWMVALQILSQLTGPIDATIAMMPITAKTTFPAITTPTAMTTPTATALAVATGTAAWVKGVNTLDSMYGYHDRQLGWGPARLDDLVMWIPARLTAVAIAIVGTPRSVGRTLRQAREWARVPISPNAGWPMATLASVLAVRLEKPGIYDLFPDQSLPTPTVATTGIHVISRTGWAWFGVVAVVVSI